MLRKRRPIAPGRSRSGPSEPWSSLCSDCGSSHKCHFSGAGAFAGGIESLSELPDEGQDLRVDRAIDKAAPLLRPDQPGEPQLFEVKGERGHALAETAADLTH